MFVKIKIIEEETGDEVEYELPSKMEVCDDCEGHSYVLNESMRNHAYTPEEMMNDFDDEEREQYFKYGGIYDVICPTCNGKNVIPVIDQESLTADQKVIFEEYKKQEQELKEYNSMYNEYMHMERVFR